MRCSSGLTPVIIVVQISGDSGGWMVFELSARAFATSLASVGITPRGHVSVEQRPVGAVEADEDHAPACLSRRPVDVAVRRLARLVMLRGQRRRRLSSHHVAMAPTTRTALAIPIAERRVM